MPAKLTRPRSRRNSSGSVSVCGVRWSVVGDKEEGRTMIPDKPTDHRPLATAVYNSRNPEMLCSSPRVRWAWYLLLLFSQTAWAAEWRRPEAQLAEKIAAITGPGVVALEVTNHSSISATETEQIRRGLIASLADSGVRISEAEQDAATVHVTLSESLQNYVWVAEIQQGTNESSVAIAAVPRPDSAINAQAPPPL